MTRLTAIVPVWNEVEAVEHGVGRLVTFLDQHFPDYEVLVIESGSKDGTAELCDALAEKMPKVRVLHEAARRGFGAALRLAFSTARGELLWIVPVDLPFPLEVLLQALPLIDRHQAVLSYRTGDQRSLFRLVQSLGFQTLTRLTLGLKTRSINSAFKLYQRNVIIDLPLHSHGWTIDAEIIYWLQHRRLAIAEIPVPVLERTHGTSTIRSMDWIRIAAELLALKRKLPK